MTRPHGADIYILPNCSKWVNFNIISNIYLFLHDFDNTTLQFHWFSWNDLLVERMLPKPTFTGVIYGRKMLSGLYEFKHPDNGRAERRTKSSEYHSPLQHASSQEPLLWINYQKKTLQIGLPPLSSNCVILVILIRCDSFRNTIYLEMYKKTMGTWTFREDGRVGRY